MLRSLMIQLFPIVIGACVEVNFDLGWITVFAPRVIKCVPVSEACSAMTKVGAREAGGLGAAGIVEARFDDDISAVECLEEEL